MNFSVYPGFIAKAIATLIERAIFKKYGCRASVTIEAIEIENDGGTTHIHLDVRGSMQDSDFSRLLKIPYTDDRK